MIKAFGWLDLWKWAYSLNILLKKYICECVCLTTPDIIGYSFKHIKNIWTTIWSSFPTPKSWQHFASRVRAESGGNRCLQAGLAVETGWGVLLWGLKKKWLKTRGLEQHLDILSSGWEARHDSMDQQGRRDRGPNSQTCKKEKSPKGEEKLEDTICNLRSLITICSCNLHLLSRISQLNKIGNIDT